MENPEVILNELLANDASARLLARHLVAGQADAEDVAQDAWVAALRNPPHRRGAVPAWLSTVVRRIATARRESDDRRRQTEESAAQLDFVAARRVETARHQVVTAVFALEEPYRTAVYLRYFEDLPPREIAERLEVSVAAVEGRLRRGLAQLRARLDRDFGDRKTWCAALLPLTGLAAGEATATTAATAGALIMGIKIKIGIAALLLAGAGLAVWNAAGDRRVFSESRAAHEPGPTPSTTTNARDQRLADPTSTSSDKTGAVADQHESVATQLVRRPTRFTVTGTVRDESGQPLADATVRAFVVNVATGSGYIPSPALQTTTDARGGFLLGPLERKLVVEAAFPGLGRERTRMTPGSTHDFVLGAPGVLRGCVTLGQDGPPCASAAVVARRVEDTTESRIHGWEILFHEVTNNEGEYEFSDLPPHRYDVRVFPTNASPTRRGVHEVVVKAKEVGTQDVVVAPLGPGIQLTGYVLDEATGEAIPGAKVHLSQNRRRCDVTGEDGRFSLGGLVGRVHPRPRRYSLRVEATSYLGKHVFVAVTGKQDVEQDIFLEKPAQVRGIVVDPTGAPVEGARVASMAFATREDAWQYRARSDAAGRFEILGLHSGTRRLFANADGFSGGVSDPIECRSGGLVDDARIRLVRGGTVSGRITDEHGKPLANIRLYLRSEVGAAARTDEFSVSARSDSNGEYRLMHIHPGRYRIFAEQRTYRDGRAVGARHLRKIVDVAEGASHRSDFTWFMGLSLSGSVLDDQNAPVAGAVIKVAPLGAATARPSSVSTDARGCFLVEGLSPGLYALTVVDHRCLLKRFEDLQAGRSGVVLRIHRKPRIRGRATFAATGRPVPRFWVQERSRTKRYTFENESGRFEIDPTWSRFSFLRPGTYFLQAGTDDGYVTSAPARLELGSGKPAPVELQLVQAGCLSGTVTNPTGKGVPHARVRLRRQDVADPAGDSWFRAIAGPDGCYAIEALPSGLYRLEASDKEFIGVCPALTVHPAGRTRGDIQLAAGGGIRVAVTDPTGQPCLASIAIEPLDAALPMAEVMQGSSIKTDASGKLHYTGLAPGPYRLRASSNRWVTAEGVVTVSSGADLSLPLQLGRGGSLHVTVVGPDRRPVVGATVSVMRDGRITAAKPAHIYRLFSDALKENPELDWHEFRQSFSRTGPRGALRRTGLPPGVYQVAAEGEGMPAKSAPVTIVEGRETSLSLTLQRE